MALGKQYKEDQRDGRGKERQGGREERGKVHFLLITSVLKQIGKQFYLLLPYHIKNFSRFVVTLHPSFFTYHNLLTSFPYLLSYPLSHYYILSSPPLSSFNAGFHASSVPVATAAFFVFFDLTFFFGASSASKATSSSGNVMPGVLR